MSETLIDGHPLEVCSPSTCLSRSLGAVVAGPSHQLVSRFDSDVIAFRDRGIGQGLRERIVVTNYGTSVVDVEIELRCDVDFADLSSR